MDGSALLTVILALGLIVLLIFGLAFVIRRLDLSPAIARVAASRGVPCQALSCRISRGCTLSIVTLGGVRFAVLNGPRSDHLTVLPGNAVKVGQ